MQSVPPIVNIKFKGEFQFHMLSKTKNILFLKCFSKFNEHANDPAESCLNAHSDPVVWGKTQNPALVILPGGTDATGLQNTPTSKTL